MTGISHLPEEICVQIFGLLPPSDLKTVMLVSKQWMVMGETPTLWTWATVTLSSKEDLQKLTKRRIQQLNLKKVKVSNWFDGSQSSLIRSTAVRPEELFNALLPITSLTYIDGLKDDLIYDIGSFICFPVGGPDQPDLSIIEPELYATVLSRLTCLCFDIINPTDPQYEALLSSIAQKDSHVKKLVFGCRKMCAQPELFAAAVSNVEECNVGLFSVPSQDMQALLVAIAEEQGQLKKLDVYSFRLSTIEPAILGTAISKLESASIYQVLAPLSKDQMAAILIKIGEDASILKKLEITGISEEQKEEQDQNVVRQAGQKIGVVEWQTEVNAAMMIDVKYSLTICVRA